MFQCSFSTNGIDIQPYKIIENKAQKCDAPCLIFFETSIDDRTTTIVLSNKDAFWCANDEIWKRRGLISAAKCNLTGVEFEFNPCVNIIALKSNIPPPLPSNSPAFMEILERHGMNTSYIHFFSEQIAINAGFIQHVIYQNVFVDSVELSKLNTSSIRNANKQASRNHLVHKYDPVSNSLHASVTKKAMAIAGTPSTNYLFNDIANAVGTTFGIEFETSEFTGAFRHLGEHYLLPLKDGSLPENGMEFCTPPMVGGASVEAVSKAMKYLQPVSKINSSCSLHVHINGEGLSRLEVCALYVLYLRIQDEINSMFPAYITSQVAIARKEKEYSARLEPLSLPVFLRKGYEDREEALFNKIQEAYTWSISKKFETPPWGNASWNCASRYTALNMVPYFTNKKTIEFRAHPPSLSHSALMDWLALIGSILTYTRKNAAFILNSYRDGHKITIYNVIEEMPNQILKERLFHVYEVLSTLRAVEYAAATDRANESAAGVTGRNNMLMSMYNQQFERDNRQLITNIYD